MLHLKAAAFLMMVLLVDDSYCRRKQSKAAIKKKGPPLPQLPKQFFSRVELTVPEANGTLYIEEYFDQLRNRAEVRIVGMYIIGNESRFIANYDTGEMYEVTDGKCVTTTLENSDLFVFPFNITGKGDVIQSSQSALNFGKKYNETYEGRTSVRGIPVDHWRSVSKGIDLTSVDYYFLVEGEWTVPARSEVTPIRSEFTTTYEGSSSGQRYEYVFFQDTLPESDEPFLTPPMVYCEGRKQTKALPELPRRFVYTAESVMSDGDLVLSYTMWYDYNNELTRVSGVPIQADSNVYGNDPFTEIRDFKAGIRYTIDTKLGNCSVTPLNDDMVDVVKKGLVSLKNVTDLFNLDITDYTYVGERKTRGINCDVWIGRRANYPEGTNLTSIWEWHFSKSEVYFNSEDTSTPRPVRMAVSFSGSDVGYQYNIIDFDDSPSAMSFSDFDITPCFEDGEIQRFEFDLLTDSGDELPKFDLYSAQEAIQTTIQITAQCSPLRITEVEVDYKQKGVHVSLALLGLPTVSGDAVYKGGRPPQPIDVLASAIVTGIVGGKFKVTISAGGVDVTLRADVDSLKQYVRTKDGQLVEIDQKRSTSPPVAGTPNPPIPSQQCVVSVDTGPRRRKRAGPPLPSLPDAFFARVEFTIPGENKTVYLEEYFDQSKDMAEIRALGFSDPGVEDRYIASYSTQEYFTISENLTSCYTSTLEEADTFTFPFKIGNGKDVILSSSEALQFGKNDNEQYIGEDVIRDIPVRHWISCINYPKSNSSLTIDYYFAVDSEWTVAGSDIATPIKSVFTEHYNTDDGPLTNIKNYEYVYFQNHIPKKSEAFLTPPLVYCPGRKNTKTVPSIPQQFSFHAESVMDAVPYVIYYDVWYDLNSQLTRVDGVPIQSSGNEYGTNPFTEIRDFQRGIRYTVDRTLGNCTIASLNADLTDTIDADGNAALKNPQNFFYLDTGNFTYVGERTSRHILTDVWIGQKQDFPKGSKVNSVWEWHFSKPGIYFNTGHPRVTHPVRFAVAMPKSQGYQYNVIDFDDSPIDLTVFDISPCFVDSEIIRFQLDLTTTTREEVPNFDLLALKTAIRARATQEAGVSLLRVQEVEIDYNQKGVHATFALLGSPTISGNSASQSSTPDLPLDVVAYNLKQSIESNKFTFNLPQGDRQLSLKAVPGSLKELMKTEDGKLILVEELSSTSSQTPAGTTRSGERIGQSQPTDGTGMSSGAVVGVAVATAVLGLLLGIGIMYLIQRKQRSGQPIQMERFR